MKLGILSDIHSNIYAFRAVMEYMEKENCDEYIFLGDYVSDTAYTRETMEYLEDIKRRHVTYFIRGNREEYMLEQWDVLQGNREGRPWKNNSASGSLLFTLEQLSEDNLRWFDSLPITFLYEKEGYPAITFAHGSPCNSRELMQFNAENTKEWMRKIDSSYMICAHTHHPGLYEIEGKSYMNAGSIGIARDNPGKAEAMILTSEKVDGREIWKPTFLRIPYDENKVIQDLFQTGLYERSRWFMNANVHIFKTGIDLNAELVSLAASLQKEELGEAVWPDIEEKYFEEASKQLDIPDYSSLAREWE